ncbi:MAG: hypothetical protein CVT83_00775 [Alphaproteobacteria bacterium HGW-Alphaproteobacteria-5]|nr:MAG: hypothetical protein CVT83_00775 [Alphaproteobacteria bacterium HGW-Alphaproteobacteria-5]
MLKNLFTPILFAASLALAPMAPGISAAWAQDTGAGQSAEAMQDEIKALVLQYADDATGLEAAVRDYVFNSSNQEMATDAVITVFTNPHDPAVVRVLNGNADLKAAGARGLGAAISLIGIDNPTLASALQAKVAASTDTAFKTAVSDGKSERDASTKNNSENNDNANGGDETSENPASGT